VENQSFACGQGFRDVGSTSDRAETWKRRENGGTTEGQALSCFIFKKCFFTHFGFFKALDLRRGKQVKLNHVLLRSGKTHVNICLKDGKDMKRK